MVCLLLPAGTREWWMSEAFKGTYVLLHFPIPVTSLQPRYAMMWICGSCRGNNALEAGCQWGTKLSNCGTTPFVTGTSSSIHVWQPHPLSHPSWFITLWLRVWVLLGCADESAGPLMIEFHVGEGLRVNCFLFCLKSWHSRSVLALLLRLEAKYLKSI